MGRGEGRVGGGWCARGRRVHSGEASPWSLAGPEDEQPGQRGGRLLQAPPGPPGVGAEALQAKCEPAARTRTGVLQLDRAGKAYLMKELWKRLLER